MAKSQDSPISQESEIFNKGLIKDYDDIFYPEGTWSHARNATNNTVGGDTGIIGNEPANKLCTSAPYTIIGQIRISSEYWAVFSTNDVDSEIGLFKENSCTYSTIVNDPCLNFKKSNLVIGTSKENFDCSYQLYWVDGLNPDRTMNVGDVRLGPFDQPWPGVPYFCEDVNPDRDCIDCKPKTPFQLDCEQIRLAKLITVPCVNINKGAAGGALQNGSYYAVVAYTINGQRYSDYYSPSEVQALFDHDNLSGSLEVTITNLDSKTFDEFELVIVRTINQQTSAKRIGLYSTQGPASISIDYIDESLPTIPIEVIPLRSPSYERSDGLYVNGPYLLRTGPRTKFDFNYQPLANQINAEWVMVEQRPDYYRRGGNDTGYMRDEQYAFWIRWIYNTGERSSSYHIPGRAKEVGRELNTDGTDIAPFATSVFDNVEYQQSFDQGTEYVAPAVWESMNTAYTLSTPITDAAALIEGAVIATGKMGYWESTERYPNDRPDIWNASAHSWSDPGNDTFDFCGKPIRHHKMPADILNVSLENPSGTNGFSRVRVNGNNPVAIRILGVQFKNIKCPVDNYGNPIPGIVGYEILRSSREGNKTVIAKGIINNLRYYSNIDGDTVYYQNYPYNSLQEDKSLSSADWYSSNSSWNNSSNYLRGVSNDKFTFHSPDTQFKNPFLSAQELKLYGEVGNFKNVTGYFTQVDDHPKHKLLTNMGFIIAASLGISLASKSVHGQEVRTLSIPRTLNAGVGMGFPSFVNGTTTPVPVTQLRSSGRSFSGSNTQEQNYQTASVGLEKIISEAITGINPSLTTFIETIQSASLNLVNVSGTAAESDGGIGHGQDIAITKSDIAYMPNGLQAAQGIVTYANYIVDGTNTVINILLGYSKYRQFATAYQSHADLLYHRKGNVIIGNSRRYIVSSGYLENQLQNFGQNTINNIYRGRAVVLDLGKNITDPSNIDNSNVVITQVGATPSAYSNLPSSERDYYIINDSDKVYDSFKRDAFSYYAGLKVRLRNQYGQLPSIKQLTTGCIIRTKLTTTSTDTSILMSDSPIIFGGDIYIGRYTEKNTFFYFYDWLMNQPDGTEFDYRLRSMVSNPRFWADFTAFDTNQFVSSMLEAIASLSFSELLDGLPSKMHNLDNNLGSGTGSDLTGLGGLSQLANAFRITIKDAYFYLFKSGVRDFFVESEINIDLRDWGNNISERHYDPYRFTNLRELFNTDIIKSGNYFKYDLSLSASRIFNNFISWGSMQARYYNPMVAETCYTYYPNRVIYSLPQQDEAVNDFWQVFLPNNYKDFTSKVTAVKPISKNGALILFDTQGPAQFLGVDTLQTDAGTKITIGDGGLFSQPLQYLTNADAEFQHGSCQNRLSITNTPVGAYFMSQSQGKVFVVTGNGLEEISASGMRWWFNRYLPYLLTLDFPNYTFVDNPIVGIGCQSVYDNSNQILYFSKRDFRKRRDITDTVEYSPKDGYNTFLVNGVIQVQLGDPAYFEDCSWTVSYDPKNQMWISFHDWHPELAVSSKNYFLTTKTNATDGTCGIWRHNDRTDLYANYYGIDYPFEIEYIAATGQTVNTLKSLEFDLECYTYDIDGIDTYHVLDFNFDHAVVHNTEQVSGVLNLNLNPKSNPITALQYPIINPTSIDIIYSKEEQKYRFNQFWDITRDRGEFTFPNVQQPIWSTELNGYKRQLNINNLDYQKPSFQRKKFRHYTTHTLLYRNISGPVKMLFKITNIKNQYSPR
jgi:hypothetical protein